MPTNTYSDQFKPSLILGIPPLSLLMNSVYLTKYQEDYHHNGSHMSQVSPDVHSNDEVIESGFFYELQTANNENSPTIRPVKVNGGKQYTGSFLIEPNLGARGVAIVMYKEVLVDKVTQVYCNVRVLPYSTTGDIISSNGKSSILVVDLPKNDIVKLNITLTPSNTGEILYKTHKTKVSLTHINPDDKNALTRELEFELAKMTAHIMGSILDVVPHSKTLPPSEFTSDYQITFPAPGNSVLKKSLLGVALIGNSIIDLTGVIAVGDINTDWQYAGDFLDRVLN